MLDLFMINEEKVKFEGAIILTFVRLFFLLKMYTLYIYSIQFCIY